MPNINQTIDELSGGGIPRYNNKINEIIKIVNWIMALRVEGGAVSEGGRGPVLMAAGAPGAGSAPWATDPDGNPAGWEKVYGFDIDGSVTGYTNTLYRQWIWASSKANLLGPGWLVDPSNVPAGWVVCSQNTFWGTGTCPVTGSGNFQAAHNVANAIGSNPYIWTGTVPNPPLVIPKSPPGIYFEAPAPASWTGLANTPCLEIVSGVQSIDVTLDVTWTFTITYDGTQIFSANGTTTTYFSENGAGYTPLNPAGWQYDPGGLPGYAKGSNKWIWQYQGPISANTNPIITQNFAWSVSVPGRLASSVQWAAVFLTG